MAFYVCLFLLVSFLMLCLLRLWSLCWPYHGPAPSRAAATTRPTLHRLLSPRCPDDCPACRLASTPTSGVGQAPAAVRPWPEVKSRRGARHSREHGGLCLSQAAGSVLRDHRCAHPRARWGWQAWSWRAHPDIPMPSLSHDVHCWVPYPSLPSEDLLPSRRHGAGCAGRRAGWFRRPTGVRLPSGQHHLVADSRGLACTDLARALLPHPADPPPPIGPLLRTRLRSHTRVLWLWLAIDPLTKMLPVLELGPRTQQMAHVLIHTLQQSLAAFLHPALYQ